nr:Cytochrome c oxidase caa3 assembly factor [uncultured organism]
MPVLILLIASLGTSPAFAHGGIEHDGIGWTTDLYIVIPIALSALAFSVGSVRLLRRTRSRHGQRRLSWRIMAYAAGWLTLALALLSPLHALGERLFTAHMIEHEILMAVSAPLLVLSRPLAMLLFALPGDARRALARFWASMAGGHCRVWLRSGGLATILHGAVLWLWHVPSVFDAAVLHDGLHRLQHLSFFLSALWFWWTILWFSSRGAATWHLFVTMMHMSVLGALMALSPRVLYTVQTTAARHYGLTPLEDQQLAGVLMWVPAGSVYAGAAMTMAALAIAQSSRRHADGHRVRHA